MRVVVVGGGITGLSAAFELTRSEGVDDIVVLEASDRFGGKVRTRPFAGRPLDEAADAFLARVPDGIDLAADLGLADHLVAPANRQAYLYSLGALRPFPSGLVLGVPTDLDALAASGTVGPEGVARAAEDETLSDERDEPARGDESVGSLVRRRMGDEVFERLVAPLLGGVHAGDADRLSVAAGAPQFAAAMRTHGRLMAGLRAQLAAAQSSPDAPVFYGLVDGMGAVVDRLVDALTDAGVQLRTATAARSVRRDDIGGYTVDLADGSTVSANALILTTPLDVTAALLAPLAPEPAAAMASVDYATVALVALEMEADPDRPLDGSGFLVAQPEGLLMTACSWASSKWAHLARPGSVVLRASVGRADDRRGEALSDDELVEAVLADLATTMDRRGRPLEARVSRWPRGLPQFEVGHLERVAAWRDALAEATPGLVVAGAGLEGLGLPACIRQGRAAARSVLTPVPGLPPAPSATSARSATT